MGASISDDFAGATRAALSNLPEVGKIGRVISLAEVRNLARSKGRSDASGMTPPAASSYRSGTAFFVSRHGWLLTSAHVIADCDEIGVVYNGKRVVASPVLADQANDIALVTAPLLPRGMDNLVSSRKITVGEDVVVAGFPLQPLLSSNINVTAGSVSGTAGPMDDARLFQFTAPIQPGNSGGPILDRHGNIIGIVTSKLDDLALLRASGSIPQNVNFGIKASVAGLVLASHGIDLSGESNRGELERTELATIAEEFTASVECR